MNNEEQSEEKKIEIHLGNDEETDPKAQRLKSLANVIATTAALLAAVTALIKPQDQTVNRNTYDQLKNAIEHTNQDVKQNHDDMVALHNYLLGYYAGDQFALPPLSSTKTVVVDAGIPATISTSTDVPKSTSIKPFSTSSKKPDVITLRIEPVAPSAAPMAPLPEPHAAPRTSIIPDFAAASKKAF